MGLAKDATIILICRSGDRSSKAQDRLQTAGYTKVYSIAEGVEGDTVKEGPKPASVPSTAGKTPSCRGPTSWTRQRCTSRAEAGKAPKNYPRYGGDFFAQRAGDFDFGFFFGATVAFGWKAAQRTGCRPKRKLILVVANFRARPEPAIETLSR
jgi:hypothetical protein